MKTFLGLDMTEIQWPRSFSPRTLAPMQTRPMQLSRPRTDPEFEFGKFVENGECARRALEGADAPDSDRSVNPEIVSS